MANVARAQMMAGLRPGGWVELFRSEATLEGDNYRALEFRLIGMPDQEHDATVLVQDSDDGETWGNDATWPEVLTPGGVLDITTTFRRHYVRVVLYSAGQGTVRVVILPKEEQANVPYVQWPNALSACATGCEVECETSPETGAP